ncbi:hypothetical protein [Streptomyces tauricus]|uniref:hypothetical protein n=1 Tax=Streptomyces tauricus TaxID=68274 RepID=UPI00343437E7
MSLWVCLDCTAAYSVGAPLCPQCGSERRAEQGAAEELGIRHGIPIDTEEENDMGKITRHTGASVEGHDPGENVEVLAVEEVEEEGGERSSDGTSSETSSEKPSVRPEQSEQPNPSPALKTGSRSAKGRTSAPGSSAPSADGGPAAGTSATDGK